MILSIVIPTYNRAIEISRCIKSVYNLLENNHFQTELIITDNASDDDTIAVAKRLCANLKNVTILQNTNNLGPSLNWLRGVQQAKGEYVLLLFSDDLLSFSENPSRLLTNLDAMKELNVDLIRLPVEICDEDLIPTPDNNLVYHPDLAGMKFGFESSKLFLKNMLYPRALKVWMREKTFSPVSPTGYIIRNTKIQNSLELFAGHKRFKTTGAGVDLITILDAASGSQKIGVFGDPVAKMVSSKTSITKLAYTNNISELSLRLDYALGATFSLFWKRTSLFLLLLATLRLIIIRVRLTIGQIKSK